MFHADMRGVVRRVAITLATLLVVALTAIQPSRAAEDRGMGLFVNLTSKDGVKAGHALHFAARQLERGHPVVVFLNNEAVAIAAKSADQASWPPTGESVRALLAGMAGKGAKVVVCQACMALQKIAETDLIDGAVKGNPDLVGGYLFDPAYQVISW